MEPKHIILGNFAWCDDYDETSFSGRLHEDCEWDAGQYWRLEWALYQLAGQRRDHAELDWPIFRIFSVVFLAMGAHLDPNDGFRILRLNRQAFYELRERFQLMFEGYFLGAMPDPRSFSDLNPLLAGEDCATP
nr:Imm41 family immunity protein [Achromobacter insuavis]